MYSVGHKSSDWQLTKNSMHEFASPTAQRKYFGSSIGHWETGPKARDITSEPTSNHLGSGSRDTSAENFATGGEATKQANASKGLTLGVVLVVRDGFDLVRWYRYLLLM